MLLPLLLNIDAAAPTGTVPNVVGETQAQATTDIGAAGFTTSVATAYSSSVAAGLVISQSPTGGSTAVLGSAVTITVSLGAASSGAGRPRRPRTRRYTIRIEGQIFEADSEEEVASILEQAKALAEKAARNKADEIVERALPKAVALGKVKPIAIKAPTISVPDDLAALADSTREAIAKTYASESANAELRLLLALRAAEDEDEEFLLLH